MKTSRMELRLDEELRRKLDQLAATRGKAASAVIRALIFQAHRVECAGAPAPERAVRTAREPRRTDVGREPDEHEDLVRDGSVSRAVEVTADDLGWPPVGETADQILAAAGLDSSCPLWGE